MAANLISFNNSLNEFKPTIYNIFMELFFLKKKKIIKNKKKQNGELFQIGGNLIKKNSANLKEISYT
jgi:hypothetical protein